MRKKSVRTGFTFGIGDPMLMPESLRVPSTGVPFASGMRRRALHFLPCNEEMAWNRCLYWSVCPNCCPPCRRPHRSMGPACAVRRAGMLISCGCRFAFCGALRTDPRPFRRRSLLERCSRQQARFANFLNWLFLVCFVGLGLIQGRPLRDVPPAVSGGPCTFRRAFCLAAPSSGPSWWRRGSRCAAGPCCTVSSRF